MEPSFLAHLEALRRIRHRSRELNGHADPVWAYNSKPSGNELARSLGLRVPAELASPRPLEHLEPPPSRACLVKPVFGAASRGVTPLIPCGGDTWLNLFEKDRGPRRWPDIRHELQEAADAGRTAKHYLIEELLEGPAPETLPYDWKFHCIDGVSQFSFIRDNQGNRLARDSMYRYFDHDWRDLGMVRDPKRIDPTLPRPRHPTELVEAAERVASALPVIFVRVDLFDTPDGVVFGEITPQPGAPIWMGPELDRRLGEAWDDAQARRWGVPPDDGRGGSLPST